MGSDSSVMVVLVHGAWHGAWSWAALQTELDRRGIPSMAVDLPGHGASTSPLGDLHGDATHVGSVLDRLAGRSTDGAPVGFVLVGHSYGGAVITEAASARDDVSHLVYVAAFALLEGESVVGALRSFPPRPVALSAAMVGHDDGTTTLDPDAASAALYGACPPEIAAAALARLDAQPMATMTQPVTGSPLGRIPSVYVRCLRDEAVHPDHQAAMAARCTTSVDLDTDHSPFSSAVVELADVLAGTIDTGTIDTGPIDTGSIEPGTVAS